MLGIYGIGTSTAIITIHISLYIVYTNIERYLFLIVSNEKMRKSFYLWCLKTKCTKLLKLFP